MIGCLVLWLTFQSYCAASFFGTFQNLTWSSHESLDALASVTVYLVLLSHSLYWRVHGKLVLDVDVSIGGVCSFSILAIGRLTLDFGRWMFGLGLRQFCMSVGNFICGLLCGRQWRWRWRWTFGFCVWRLGCPLFAGAFSCQIHDSHRACQVLVQDPVTTRTRNRNQFQSDYTLREIQLWTTSFEKFNFGLPHSI